MRNIKTFDLLLAAKTVTSLLIKTYKLCLKPILSKIIIRFTIKSDK